MEKEAGKLGHRQNMQGTRRDRWRRSRDRENEEEVDRETDRRLRKRKGEVDCWYNIHEASLTLSEILLVETSKILR